MTARELHHIIQPLFLGMFVLVDVSAVGEKDYYHCSVRNQVDGLVDWDSLPVGMINQAYTPEGLIENCKKVAEGGHREATKTKGV